MMARIYRRGMVRFELGVKSEGVMNGEVVRVKKVIWLREVTWKVIDVDEVVPLYND